MMLEERLGPTPWACIQDVTKRAGFAVGFIAIGVWGDGVYNGTAKLPWLHQQAATLRTVQTKVIPALKAEAGCEHWRADVTTDLAKQPVIVDPSQIPKDCPHTAVK